MNFKKIKFVKSFAQASDLPRASLAEVVFVGKSNVGKSTLINSLCKQKKLAKTSSTPGKTRLINFFEVRDGPGAFYLVDLPGYGYAKISELEKLKWQELIEGYFYRKHNIAQVCCLIDIRHDPSSFDLWMHEFIKSTGLPFCVVLTKADKISNQKRKKRAQKIQSCLNIPEGLPILATSSRRNLGMLELETTISQYLSL
ncbi:MAG: YihA family ribosome biogenesis GTP-binding protein [Eggerthellaceae bacterium]|nr:YihA family ribosome biogenesis GTP-binding protein [Eggerthellaceae bacterium]